MPMYTYKTPDGKLGGNFDFPMDHEVPTCGELFPDCPEDLKDVPAQRVYNCTFILKGGGWTEKTSQTIEKKKKLKKLWDDSQVGDQPNPYFDDMGNEKDPSKQY